jgi:hypothetical protein
MHANLRELFDRRFNELLRNWFKRPEFSHQDKPHRAEELRDEIDKHLGQDIRPKLGSAFKSGILAVDPGHGGSVLLLGHPPRPSTGSTGSEKEVSFALLTSGGTARDQADICKEALVQLTEYAAFVELSRAYEGRLQVRVEDDDMDVTVSDRDGRLIAYSEIKRSEPSARGLWEKMVEMRGRPVPPRTGRKTPDSVKKLNYLLRAAQDRPQSTEVFFAVRSPGLAERGGLYEETGLAAVTLGSRPENGAVAPSVDLRPCSRDPDGGERPVPLPVLVERSLLAGDRDALGLALTELIWGIERRRTDTLVRRGTRRGYIVYRERKGNWPILLGVERDRGLGATRIYSDPKALHQSERAAFEAALGGCGVTLGESGSGSSHRMWKVKHGVSRGRASVQLGPEQARRLAAALPEALSQDGAPPDGTGSA